MQVRRDTEMDAVLEKLIQPTLPDLGDCISNFAARHQISPPFIIGIVGPPAAGKSTLAGHLSSHLGAKYDVEATWLPMDGFHYDNDTLVAMGLRHVKGTIETFDVEALATLLSRIRKGERELYWPTYSRKTHNPISQGIWIGQHVQIFVLEGNYLFYDDSHWGKVRSACDIKLYLSEDNRVLAKRLISRHMQGGRDADSAKHKVHMVDMKNAVVVEQTSIFVDIYIDGPVDYEGVDIGTNLE